MFSEGGCPTANSDFQGVLHLDKTESNVSDNIDGKEKKLTKSCGKSSLFSSMNYEWNS